MYTYISNLPVVHPIAFLLLLVLVTGIAVVALCALWRARRQEKKVLSERDAALALCEQLKQQLADAENKSMDLTQSLATRSDELNAAQKVNAQTAKSSFTYDNNVKEYLEKIVSSAHDRGNCLVIDRYRGFADVLNRHGQYCEKAGNEKGTNHDLVCTLQKVGAMQVELIQGLLLRFCGATPKRTFGSALEAARSSNRVLLLEFGPALPMAPGETVNGTPEKGHLGVIPSAEGTLQFVPYCPDLNSFSAKAPYTLQTVLGSLIPNTTQAIPLAVTPEYFRQYLSRLALRGEGGQKLGSADSRPIAVVLTQSGAANVRFYKSLPEMLNDPEMIRAYRPELKRSEPKREDPTHKHGGPSHSR